MKSLQVMDKLNQLRRKEKMVLMGIGNIDRGDDGVGVLLASRLASSNSIKSIVCEDVPENYTGVVRSENPNVILLLDAVDFGGEPGDVILLEADELTGDRFSTHRPSLKLLMDYLSLETKADTLLLGIQPACIQHNNTLSHGVQESLNLIEKLLSTDMGENECQH
jgi:hydrogenase 3 maturation protease